MSQHPRPKFTYLGHATILCELPGGETVLIDPWVQNNPACPKELKELKRVDAMLITHAHGDHMGDAVEIAKKHRPQTVVANYEICNWLTQKGVENCAGMNLGGTQEVLGMQVTMVRADHPAASPTATRPCTAAWRRATSCGSPAASPSITRGTRRSSRTCSSS